MVCLWLARSVCLSVACAIFILCGTLMFCDNLTLIHEAHCGLPSLPCDVFIIENEKHGTTIMVMENQILQNTYFTIENIRFASNENEPKTQIDQLQNPHDDDRPAAPSK